MYGIKQFSRSALLAAIERVKTPFYCYDEQVCRSRFTALRGALPRGWQIYYAAKANPNVALLKVYRKLGARAECASAGEILACMKAGYKAGELALSGPVKSSAEYAAIRKNRPFVIHAESVEELLALNRLGKRLDVALRLNMDLGLSRTSGAKIMTGGHDKFGFSPKEAATVLAKREIYGSLNFVGFHIYMGTQIKSANQWLKGARKFLERAARLSRKAKLRPVYINFGGGLGIPYGTDDREFDLVRFKTGLEKLDRWAGGLPEFSDARFYLEPGRYLVGPAGVYVVKLLAVKTVRGKRFAMTDGGIHHALFPFRVSREFPVKLLNRNGGGKKRDYFLGGPLCTSLDQSDLPARVPPLKAGDILGIFQSGSYGFSTGMHFFLSHPMPAEVMWDGKNCRLIRKPSPSAHLFASQTDKLLAK